MAENPDVPSAPAPNTPGRATSAAPASGAASSDQLSADVPRGVGAIFGLAGFAMSVVSSMASGAGAIDALTTAILSMLVCFFVGYACGLVLAGIIREHNRDYERRNPIPRVELEPPMDVEPEPNQPNETQPSGQAAQPAKSL